MAMTKCKECGAEISTKAVQCPKCGAKAPKKTSILTWIIAGFFALGFIGYISGNKSGAPASGGAPHVAGTADPSLPPPPSKESAIHHMDLDFTWSTEGFGDIMKATFTVTNKNAYPVKDLEITCTHSAASGTVIDRNKRTIFEIVPANKKKVFKDFNMGFIHSQAKSSSCEITDLSL